MIGATRGLTGKRLTQQCMRAFSTRLTPGTQCFQNRVKLTYPNLTSKRFTSSDSDALQQGITDIDANTFHKISEEYLETLTDSLEALSEENPQIDAEYSVCLKIVYSSKVKTNFLARCSYFDITTKWNLCHQ